MNRLGKILTTTATLAAVGLAATGCTAGGAAVPQSVDAAGTSIPTVGADKATQIMMNIPNSTGETWNLSSASRDGTWQDRPTATLDPGVSIPVSTYSGGSGEVTVVYTGAQSGYSYTFVASVPILPGQSASTTGTTTTNPGYQINGSSTGDWNVTFDYIVDGIQNYPSTGATTKYTVPVGVTRLHVTADGGGSVTQWPYSAPASQGAQVDGELPVTPGEVLTIGVGGTGTNAPTTVGGWGMTNGASSFSGGSGSGSGAGGGGGATVVFDPSGILLLVAGGAGGGGGTQDAAGGDGGYQGSLTGQNGGPNGQGGAAGANTTSQGQNVNNSAGGAPSGAGGGGYPGGLGGAYGNGAAGGAGSSYLGYMYTNTVTTAAATAGSLMLVPDAFGSTPARGSVALRP